ncbi:MAG: DUF547 domain-containing protein [Haliscomenobacter sp.]|uniref:DUF547 domain-containing protein n=1 Tax=Haliscomenobacter sp. TaxID=2717303 RepID=UPI0029B13B6B|nr:DUF547 domain-containing protein [Haliscomenobacter sp.]MDX2070460.1 DUF547 domain-containing protein [Haliscomenobacter sp.]
MKKQVFLITRLMVLAMVWLSASNCVAIRRNTNSSPINHDRWDQLVKKHVKDDGFVDYKGFVRDSNELNSYLDQLSAVHPNDKSWSRNEQMAYWINAYNAFTIKLIVNNYPVESIKDIKKGIAFVNSVWDIKFIKIQGFTYDLNNIEHNILRPVFKDARVHAAVNCASFSCPRLRQEAYTPEKLDSQLDDAMKKFLADPLRNNITAEKVEISEIFKWFKGDFDRDAGSLIAYINKFSAQKISAQTELKYLDYNWALNEAKGR